MSDTTDATPVASNVTPDPVAVKLLEFGASSDAVEKIKQLGVESVDDLATLTEADLTATGLLVVKARKLLASVKPVAEDATPVLSSAAIDGLLPAVADDSSWLKSLQTGGVLKVDTSSVTAVLRAALANRVGLYDVPKKLVSAMETFAEESDEQVNPLFYKIRRQLVRRDFAEVFAAIDGLDGSFFTEARKNQLLKRVDERLWPAISSFQEQLRGWQDSWMQGAANPAMLMMVLSSGGAMPSSMVQSPDTSSLRDAAAAVNDAVNSVFAGIGVQIAAGLSYEALKIKGSLEDTQLPGLIGVANREQMLKKLNVAVPATYARLETNLTRYVLGVIGLENQAAGDEETRYLGALFTLGNQIDWSTLGASGRYSTLGRGPLTRSMGERAVRDTYGGK